MIFLILRRWIVILFVGLFLEAFNAMPLDPSIDAVAKAGFEDLRRGDDTALDGLSAPELRTPDGRATVTQLRGNLPIGVPKSEKTITWSHDIMAMEEQSAYVVNEYNFGPQVIYWGTRLHKYSATDPWLIQGFQLNYAPVSKIDSRQSRIINKSPVEYMLFLTMILSLILLIAAFIMIKKGNNLRDR